MQKKKSINQINNNIRVKKLELINNNLLNNYNRLLKQENIEILIKNQIRFVKSIELNSNYRKKHLTIILLENYKNTKNKTIALNNLTNTLCKKGIFSLFN